MSRGFGRFLNEPTLRKMTVGETPAQEARGQPFIPLVRAIIDPREELVAIVAAQHVPSDGEFTKKLQTLIYQSIVGE